VKRPLLYYAGKLARSYGYETVTISFSGIRKDIQNLNRVMRECDSFLR